MRAMIVLIVLVTTLTGRRDAQAQPAAPDRSALQTRCEFGITQAFAGKLPEARKTFLSMLDLEPGNARALNDLGNLSLMEGDPVLARAFYGRARASDSLDAGIRLNLATAWMLDGHNDEAEEEAAAGIELAGGLPAARRLLGMRNQPGDFPAKERADKARITKLEVRELLERAQRNVPADSVHRALLPVRAAAGTRAPARSRPAGPRASGDTDALDVLYWKR